MAAITPSTPSLSSTSPAVADNGASLALTSEQKKRDAIQSLGDFVAQLAFQHYGNWEAVYDLSLKQVTIQDGDNFEQWETTIYGALTNGRLEGPGKIVTHYTGMDGRPAGTHIQEGMFLHGQLHGTGRWAPQGGAIQEGQFKFGKLVPAEEQKK